MGFFSRLFSSEIEYPPLDMNAKAAKQLDAVRDNIEAIAEKVQVPIEVVPDEGGAYIFAGEPPKQFGVFWVDRGEVGNLKEMADKKGMSEQEMMKLSEHLRAAYIKSQAEQRFRASTSKGGKMIVTPSISLLRDVKKIIASDVH